MSREIERYEGGFVYHGAQLKKKLAQILLVVGLIFPSYGSGLGPPGLSQVPGPIMVKNPFGNGFSIPKIPGLTNKNTDKINQGIKTAQDTGAALSLSPQQEDAYGQYVGASLLGQSGADPNQTLQTYVNLVGLTVAASSPNPGGNYVFGVLNRKDVNAFSGPNGYIFVTRGAIDQMRDEAELAGVLGHEIAHVCHHDGLNQLKAAANKNVFGDIVQMGNKGNNVPWLSDKGVEVITNVGYDQPQESKADADGVKYMAAAGYDPRSYLRFLQRLQSLEGADPKLSVMSTHPGIGERIQKVQAEIDSMHVTGGATLEARFTKNVNSK